MKYFIDTEFLEGKQRLRKTFLEALLATKKYTEPTIDLISIGVVSEDSREYYAISKDFNLKEAWNRYDEKINENYAPSYMGINDGNYNPQFIREYWIRDNVLKPIFADLYWKDLPDNRFWSCHRNSLEYESIVNKRFTYKEFKRLIKKYGKSNKQIAEEIKKFTYYSYSDSQVENANIQFYGYFADYHWVVFCWLFGKMIDLPTGFPKYCIDLKQELDEIGNNKKLTTESLESWLELIKQDINYPKQTNEHHALQDAHFNYNLYKFLQTI